MLVGKLLVRLVQFWTDTGQNDGVMDSYWKECCWFGQLVHRLKQVWGFIGQTDAYIDDYCCN